MHVVVEIGTGSSMAAHQLLSRPKIYSFCSFSLSSHYGYTQLGRHY